MPTVPLPATICSHSALPPSCQTQVLQERGLLFSTSWLTLQVECGKNGETQLSQVSAILETLVRSILGYQNRHWD